MLNIEEALGLIHHFHHETPIEVRFHATYSGKSFQLLASVASNGVVSYTLHRVPRGHYAESIANIALGRDGENHRILPMKAYQNWQGDVLLYIVSIMNRNNEPIYAIDEVF